MHAAKHWRIAGLEYKEGLSRMMILEILIAETSDETNKMWVKL